MDRRGFLAGMLAACAAPAIVRADSLMRIVPRELELLVPNVIVGTGNYLLTPEMITKEALAILSKNLEMSAHVSSQYDESFKSLNNTLRIRRPRKFEIN